MQKKLTMAVLTVALCTWADAQRANAQGLEATGKRAAALAAFVAVSNDASAVVWNPAGLIAGPIFNISIDLGQSTISPDAPPAPPAVAGRLGTTLLAAGVPPLGLSYYRMSVTNAEAASPAVRGTPGRENSEVIVRTL